MKRTIDREQGRARLLDEAAGSDARAGRDLAWIVAIGIVVAAVLILTKTFSHLTDWADDLSSGTVDGLLAVLIIVPIGAVIYALRRYAAARSDRATLRRLSFHDALTGLPNRRFLGDGFDQMLKSSRRGNGRVAVLFVDLRGFEEVNATLGPAVGDQLMVAVAARLVSAVGRDDRTVRYGGDQFVIFCPDVSTAVSAERVALTVLKAIETPFVFGETTAELSADIGVAITEERCTRPDEVLRDADAALMRARPEGPGGLVMFDRAERDALTPSNVERRLREALANGEFRLYYQPIVSLWTNRLVAVEALLRWNDPARGLISPDDFLPALEETGLIVPIGSWVIEEVARQSRAWQDRFPDRPAINIKVNVSARQLAQANVVAHLVEALERAGTDPARIYLEISESVLQADPESMWGVLRDAQQHGVSLALDDFGTGYSSLNYLRQLELDMLTVDKSFVDGLGLSSEDAIIVEHIIGIAKSLGIVTVAEGVEEAGQIEQLRKLNCDLAQGYFFSHPQPPYVITELLGQSGGSNEWRPVSSDGFDPEAAQDAPVVVVDAPLIAD